MQILLLKSYSFTAFFFVFCSVEFAKLGISKMETTCNYLVANYDASVCVSAHNRRITIRQPK